MSEHCFSIILHHKNDNKATRICGRKSNFYYFLSDSRCRPTQGPGTLLESYHHIQSRASWVQLFFLYIFPDRFQARIYPGVLTICETIPVGIFFQLSLSYQAVESKSKRIPSTKKIDDTGDMEPPQFRGAVFKFVFSHARLQRFLSCTHHLLTSCTDTPMLVKNKGKL